MDTVHIDGSQGEGGGQILRSSLTLSALTGRPVQITNIRAGRRKPGLLRQHLTAVRAAAAVCGAEVDGAQLRSGTLSFRPGAIRAGEWTFSVGSAGSTTLVCQTVLPILLSADGPSSVSFEGGTHNPMAPPFDFLDHVYFPVLRRMGAGVDAGLEVGGFYPAGGGRFRVRVTPDGRPEPVPQMMRRGAPEVQAWVYSPHLAKHVATREKAIVREGLGLERGAVTIARIDSPGPGNAVCVAIEHGDARELVTSFGDKRTRAEAVAEDAVAQARVFLNASAPVGEHLADMLVLLVALYGGGFETEVWSSHSATNAETVAAFLGDVLEVEHGPDFVRVARR